jgi:ribosome biogenesis GTPase
LKLEDLGWNPDFSMQCELFATDGVAPGRIAMAARGSFRVMHESGETLALAARHLRQTQLVTGDWVALDPAARRIVGLAARRTCVRRRRPGARGDAQPLAANVDIVFIVCGLDGDFNPRRIERYLVVARDSGARAAIVLNKSDLHHSPWAAAAQVQELADGLPVILACARDGTGLEEIDNLFVPGETAVLLGSSGAGKSTIVNRLLGTDRQRTFAVRDDDSRGRHTTTARELVILPSGRLVIDTPGLREVGLSSGVESVAGSFPDIEALAAGCRFRDCQHEGEPDCAVEAAVEAGELSAGRLASFHKLRREARFLETKEDAAAAWRSKQEVKRLHRQIRRFYRP